MAKSRYFLSVDLDDMKWGRELVLRHGFGLEIVDFSRSLVLDHSFDSTIENWKKLLGSLPAGTSIMLHGPFYDLYPFSRDEKVAAVARARYTRALEAASTLGARAVVFHSGYLPCVTNYDYPQQWVERNSSFWPSVLEEFPHISVFVENMWDPSPDHLFELSQKLHSNRFGICFDIGHAHAYSKVPIEDWLRRLGASLVHVHANDNNGAHDEELPLGKGSVRYSSLAGVLLNQDAIGVTLEVLGREASMESYEAMRAIGL